jgi:hypothetical protein
MKAEYSMWFSVARVIRVFFERRAETRGSPFRNFSAFNINGRDPAKSVSARSLEKAGELTERSVPPCKPASCQQWQFDNMLSA